MSDYDRRLAVALNTPLTGVCKVTACRAASTLYADLRYCDVCEDTLRCCFQVHPKYMSDIDKTEICDRHGLEVRKWDCLVRIYSRE